MAGNNYGANLLANLKAVAGMPGPQLGLQVGTNPATWLRPVATRREVQSERDIACLTEWRNLYVTAFLNEFRATDSQTSDWLANVVGPDDTRILFMVDDSANETFGYMGIGYINWETGYGEADAIVRGRPAPKGAMTSALQTLLRWGQGQLGLARIGVRVRSDNPALSFYRRFGFVEEKRVPLSCRILPGKTTWYEDPSNTSPEVTLVYHSLTGGYDAGRSYR